MLTGGDAQGGLQRGADLASGALLADLEAFLADMVASADGPQPILLAEANGIELPSTIDPDSITTYELGAKSLFLDGSLLVEGAVFYSDWEGVAVRVPITSTINGLTNSKGTENKGVEVNVVYTPSASLMSSALHCSRWSSNKSSTLSMRARLESALSVVRAIMCWLMLAGSVVWSPGAGMC